MTRKAGLAALMHLGRPAALTPEELVPLLGPDNDGTTREAARAVLADMGEKAVPSLVKLLTPNADEITRQWAISVLETMGTNGAAAVPDLIKLLSAGTVEGTRQSLVSTLGAWLG